MKKTIAFTVMFSLWAIILPVALLRIIWQTAVIGWEVGDDAMKGLVKWWKGN